MSKKISYKGKLAMGGQDRLQLATMKGKIAYRIVKFQIMSTLPGGSSAQELIGRAFTSDKTSNTSATIDFTDSSMLATSITFHSGNTNPTFEQIIFDNEKTNQDIYVTIIDAAGGTVECNYYLELETDALSDVEATQLTLKNLRTVASR
jgi:PKD repeat protein